MAYKVSEQLFDDVLNRMNITWDIDDQTKQNIRNAIEEAQDYLRKIAGNPELSFEDGELRNLIIAGAWYFVENKRAEFSREYSGELIALRLEEAFSCGKESEDAI